MSPIAKTRIINRPKQMHFLFKNAFLPLVALVMANCLSAETIPSAKQQSTLEKIRKSGELIIGYRPDALPFSFNAESKEPIGFVIDLCRSLAVSIQKETKLDTLKIRYLPVDAKSRFDKLLNGNYDIECANTTNTRERREKIGVAFTIPHYMAGTRMLVRTADRIKRLEDMHGKIFISTKGTTSLSMAHDRNQAMGLEAKIHECDLDLECFRAIEEKTADAYLMDDIVLYSFRANARKPEDFEVVGKFLSIEPLAIMFRKNDPTFKKLIDVEMARMIYSREFSLLYKQWFERPIPPNKINLNIPMNYLLRDSLKFPSDNVGN